MCLVNRTSAEPPNHADCAEWSARACPFLTTPKKVRRESGIPEGASIHDAAGIAIARNPGVTALIDCSKWKLWNPGNGVLFQMAKSTTCRGSPRASWRRRNRC